MSLVKCPDCKHSVSDTALRCPKCYGDIPVLRRRRRRAGAFLSRIVIIAFLNGIVFSFFRVDISLYVIIPIIAVLVAGILQGLSTRDFVRET